MSTASEAKLLFSEKYRKTPARSCTNNLTDFYGVLWPLGGGATAVNTTMTYCHLTKWIGFNELATAIYL